MTASDTYTPTAWCPTCHTRREVVEDTIAEDMTYYGAVEYHVIGLECGHETQGDARPVAGPGLAAVTPGGGR